MKKLFAVLVVFALVLAGCAQPANEENPSSKLPSLTIRNLSSYELTNVKFEGITVAKSETAEFNFTDNTTVIDVNG